MNRYGPASPPLPDALVKRGAEMMDRECSLWGADVKHPDGNLLVRHGFQRHPSAGGVGSSCYVLLRGDATIILRGYGSFLRTRALGEVFVPRFQFTPRYTVCPGDPLEASLPAYAERHQCPTSAEERSRADPLFLRTLQWIATYEDWICDALPLTESRGLILPRDPATRAPEAWPAAWRALADECADALAASTLPVALAAH